MKKLFVLGAVVALFAGTTSCKKTYTCECYDFTTGATTTRDTKSKKDTADEACAVEANTLQGEICVGA